MSLLYKISESDISWIICICYTKHGYIREEIWASRTKKREWLDVGTVPTFKKYNIGTVPTFKKYNIGTVPTFKKYNIGTVPTFKKYNIGTLKIS